MAIRTVLCLVGLVIAVEALLLAGNVDPALVCHESPAHILLSLSLSYSPYLLPLFQPRPLTPPNPLSLSQRPCARASLRLKCG